jgi:hypothetical protein
MSVAVWPDSLECARQGALKAPNFAIISGQRHLVVHT